MDNTYKVWMVYEPGRIWYVAWYVVNTKEKRCQSVWESYDDAKRVCSDLNTKWRIYENKGKTKKAE